MKMLSKLLIFLMITNNVMADDVIPLLKGAPAPYSGVLFPLDKAKDMQKTVIERDNYKLLNYSLQESIDLDKKTEAALTAKVDYLFQQNSSLSDEVYKFKESNSWHNFMWFLTGVLATTITVYGVSKIK